MGLGARRYSDLYTWSHGVTDHVIAHTDGAVSLALGWSGIDTEFVEDAGRTQAFVPIARLLERLPAHHWFELHLWRDYSNRTIDEYVAHYAQAPRPSPFAARVRQALADHVRGRVLLNETALIVGRLPGRSHGIRRQLRDQIRYAAELEDVAAALADQLPGGRRLAVADYVELIAHSYGGRVAAWRADPWLTIAEQIIAAPPKLAQSCIDLQGRMLKIFYLHLYPDAQPGWALPVVSLPAVLHISQTILARDTEHALRMIERADRLAQGTLEHKGRERQLAILKDMQGFRQTVAAQTLAVHRNAMALSMTLVADRKSLTEAVIGRLEAGGGRVRDDAFIQLPFLRSIQPGQGYRSVLWRPDHSVQLCNMAPVQVFRNGSAYPESLRLGLAGQTVAFDYSHQPVAHAFTIAMTGAGKGVDKVATIAETYPFGIDWYVLEIGGTYQWVVEALGGLYTRLDPAAAAVNPLPPRPADGAPLDPILAAATVNILAFLLTDGRTVLTVHESAAAGAALARLYAHAAADPGLVELLAALESLTDLSIEQMRAAHNMAANLHSFLDTAEGRIFAGHDNVQISAGISGVDLRDVDRASPRLLTFYLVFLCLRFLNLAFANRRPARVLLDEIHRFVAHAPDVMRRLVSVIARMGRKEAAAVDIVTQGLAEIDVMEAEIVNSMPLRSLLYRTDGWQLIADRIGMPAAARAIWQRLPYPLDLDWRPAIRSVGPDYYALCLSFPSLLLHLADTSPEGLARKMQIGRETQDPLARLARFAQP
ncbi:MAG: hypothetical protein ACYCXG_06680 [Acidiferrobacter sp.]